MKTEIQPAGGADKESQAFLDTLINDRDPGFLLATKPEVPPALTDAAALPPITKLALTILVPDTAKMSVADAIATDLRQRGHDLTRIQKVDISIKDRNIRYFHTSDRQEATRLAKAYDAELKDFTWFRPKPDRGTTEVWLSGRGARVTPPTAKKPAQIIPEVTEPVVPRIVIVRRKPSLLKQIFSGNRAVPNTAPRQSDDENGSKQAASATVDNATDDTGTGIGDGTDTTGTDTTGGTDTSGDTDTSGGADTTGGTDTSGTGGTDTSGTGDTGSGDTGSGDTDGGSDLGDSGSAGSDAD